MRAFDAYARLTESRLDALARKPDGFLWRIRRTASDAAPGRRGVRTAKPAGNGEGPGAA